MTDLFDNDDLLLDDEWVELSDLEGHRASFRHLATIGISGKTYLILGSHQNGSEEPGALMLIREDDTADGSEQYVVVNDRHEIEQVIGRFVMRLLTAHLRDEQLQEDDVPSPCGCKHKPGDFCFCEDPAYLQ